MLLSTIAQECRGKGYEELIYGGRITGYKLYLVVYVIKDVVMSRWRIKEKHIGIAFKSGVTGCAHFIMRYCDSGKGITFGNSRHADVLLVTGWLIL